MTFSDRSMKSHRALSGLLKGRRRFEERYEILNLISESYKTEIYKAYDRKLKTFVAVKIIKFDAPAVILSMSDFIKRWDRMCKYTRKLKHPNILSMLDNGINHRKNFIYYSTFYVSGFSLADFERLRKLNLKEKLKIATDLVDAVAYAHGRGVIHRDIKPSNILVDNSGKAYITDFQSARFESSPITKPGMTLGTPLFMSPEQIKGIELGNSSDIFSLGNVFYYLFSGKTAFSGGTFIEISNKIVNVEPDTLIDTEVELPKELISLISGMLKKDPNERVTDYRYISKTLGALLEKI
jgi:serine/threonine protein kinase